MSETALSLIKIIVGIVLIGLPIYVLIFNVWGLLDAVWLLVKAGVVIGVALIGLIFLVLGFTELK
ncbi:MAG: hypothetical protein PHT54_02530 [Candidatus Nanoarchaeia archaeon]|nr:hypothetical protein [Candidatus Nanoarchaeia archaeon]